MYTIIYRESLFKEGARYYVRDCEQAKVWIDTVRRQIGDKRKPLVKLSTKFEVDLYGEKCNA